MSKFLTFGFAAVLAFVPCAGAHAQSRGGHPMPARIASPPATRMVRVVPTQVTGSQAHNGVVVVHPAHASSFVSFNTIPFESFNAFPFETFPVPGLGFDFAHLAAINGNFRRTVFVHPLHHFPSVGVPFLPIFGGFGGVSPEVVVVQQPPVVIQQPVVQEEASEPVARGRPAAPVESAAPMSSPAPPQDVREYVLIRRDGRVIFAVGFLTAGDQVIYITREGIRRSLPLADLDIEGTRRMNEERGIVVRLPA